jgi:hypothetical protein
MRMMRNIFKRLLLAAALLCGIKGFALVDKLNRAITLHQAKNSDAARMAIDSVIRHPETKSDPMVWTMRAYIYFEIYKRSDKFKLNSPLRDTIISSVKQSNALKPDAEYLANNKKLNLVMAAGLYNLSAKLLQDSISSERSLKAYTKSKEIAKSVRPDSNFTTADIEYYNTVGSIFSDVFNRDNNDLKAQDKAKVGLLKVLELQPDNGRANYNLGIMYYNQAVNLGKSLDYGADISQIDVIQESIIKLAKQSEQLIDKVYKKEPKNLKAIEALYFIYRMLNDNAKTEEFKKKCTENGIKLD